MVKRARATSTASADTTHSDTYDDRAVTVSPSAKRRAVHSSSGTASSAASTASADAAPVAPKVVKSEQRKLRNRESAQASRDRKKAEREELGLQLAQAEERVLELEQENAKLRADAALREAHQSSRTAELEQQLRTFEDRFKALETLLTTAQSAPTSQPLLPSASSSSSTNLELQAPSTTSQSTGLAGSETHALACTLSPVDWQISSNGVTPVSTSSFDATHIYTADSGLDFLAYDFSQNANTSQPNPNVQSTPLFYPEANSSADPSFTQSTASNGQTGEGFATNFVDVDSAQATVDEFLAHFASSSLQRPFVDRHNSWSFELSQDPPALQCVSALSTEHIFDGINLDDFLAPSIEPAPWLNFAQGNAILA